MTSYIHELPTTGAISFSNFVLDTTEGNAYTSCIAEVTQARANLRAILKQSRRIDGQDRDYLRIVKVIDDYVPHLRGIIACIQSGELHLKYEPGELVRSLFTDAMFSWRTTLSATLFKTSPRLRLPSLEADLAYTLLTYAMALSNFSRSVITSLGTYEYERAISDKDRKEKDEKLNFGVTLLCKASGLFSAISDGVLCELDKVETAGGWVRPPDLSKEVNVALAKMALADAQSLAIRKLLSRAAFESTFSPGPPLPKSHPSVPLLAKLHLDCAALYSSARTLAMAPSKSSVSPGLRANLRSISKSQGDSGGSSGEVSTDLLKYLDKESRFHAAIAHKWLGVDAGEAAQRGKGGEAVAFLRWAQQELEDLQTLRLGRGLGIGRDGVKDRDQDGKRRQDRRARTEKELKFLVLDSDKTDFDSPLISRPVVQLTFDPIPKQSELQARVPEGKMAIAAKTYLLPDPAFGPGSKGYCMRVHAKIQRTDALGLEALRIDDQSNDNDRGTMDDNSSDDDNNAEGVSAPTRTYVGAGSYF